jgi:hypothetical protein
MDDRCHEAWPENGRFLDLGAGEAEDEGAKKSSESAQVSSVLWAFYCMLIPPVPGPVER